MKCIFNVYSNLQYLQLDSITVNRSPTLDNELLKKNLDDAINKNIILRFNQSVQNYTKVTVGKSDDNFAI